MNDWLTLSLRDAVDILLVAFVMYRILLILRGSRALQVLVGLFLVFSLYLMANYFGLVTLVWVLDHFFTYLVLILVILFQDEIRTALTRIGNLPFIGRQHALATEVLDDIVRAVYELRDRGVGALIVFERDSGLGTIAQSGKTLDAQVSRELIVGTFVTANPLHDGAIVIRGSRIVAAGCFLPLAMDHNLPREMGTRHRAALGLSRESDALTIVVSEEQKAVSLVFEGEFQRKLAREQLREQLALRLGQKNKVTAFLGNLTSTGN